MTRSSSNLRRAPPLLWAVFLFLLALPPARAGEGAATPASAAPMPVPAGLASPRATVTTFLHAMNDIRRGDPKRIGDAVATLDLSDVNPLVRAERGSDLAWTLLEVLDRTRVVHPQRIPDHQTGSPWVFQAYAHGVVRVSRQDDGRWLFDRTTVNRLPQILEDLSGRGRVVGAADQDNGLPLHLRLRRMLPSSLKASPFLLENWQWLGLLVIVAVGVVADWLLALGLRLLVRQWLRRRNTAEYRGVSPAILRPLGLMAMALVWWAGMNLLGLPEFALLILLLAVKFLASVSGVWAAYRLVDLLSAPLLRHARRTANKVDDMLAPLVPRTLKIFVTVIGVVFIADNLNIDISGLLAGLGLGGLAFALAAKDMVQNLFGSITVLLDRTFTVGDWIRVGDQEGTVEQIGFRSTRIRTFYHSMLTVPNSTFITANVDNMGKRRFRRLRTTFNLTYDTAPDRIEAYCEGIRELVRQHPYMRKDYYHVYLNGLGASSLEVLVYVFWEAPDWATELRERHRFLLDCLRLAQRLGVEMAFPTQTLYLRRDGSATPEETLDLEGAFGQGRELAKAVVAETTGLGVRPPPVTF